jgi:hypothetical protein
MRTFISFTLKSVFAMLYVRLVIISIDVMYKLIKYCESLLSLIPLMFIVIIWILLLILSAMITIAILIEPINKNNK